MQVCRFREQPRPKGELLPSRNQSNGQPLSRIEAAHLYCALEKGSDPLHKQIFEANAIWIRNETNLPLPPTREYMRLEEPAKEVYRRIRARSAPYEEMTQNGEIS